MSDGGMKRRFDPGSAAAGLFFLAAAGVFLVTGLSGEPVAPPEILAAAVLLGLGLVGVVRVLTRGRRSH